MCKRGRSTSLLLIKIKHLPWKVKLALSTKNVGVIHYKTYLSVELAFSVSLTFLSPSPSFRNSERNHGTPFIKAVPPLTLVLYGEQCIEGCGDKRVLARSLSEAAVSNSEAAPAWREESRSLGGGKGWSGLLWGWKRAWRKNYLRVL